MTTRILQASGLSPHGRGKRGLRPGDGSHLRSIPARAGETICWSWQNGRWRVYPRTGGGNPSGVNAILSMIGLSPHGRGKLPGKVAAFASAGSIPARAGETQPPGCNQSQSRVYPRTGGGNLSTIILLLLLGGLSPHGRGKPRSPAGGVCRRGSIPARAGETPRGGLAWNWWRVYPRTGGGNLCPRHRGLHLGGLSPHGRGKRGQAASGWL